MRRGEVDWAALGTTLEVPTLDRAKLSDRLGVLPREALTEVEDGLRAALDLE